MKKIYFSIFLTLILFGLLLFAGNHADAQGLLPCGEAGNPCKLCHFFVLFKNIIDFVLTAAGIIAVLMLTIGGIMFLFAGSNPGNLENAKKILTSTVIGLVITFGSWLIINSIFTFPGFVSASFDLSQWYNPSSWFSASCP